MKLYTHSPVLDAINESKVFIDVGGRVVKADMVGGSEDFNQSIFYCYVCAHQGDIRQTNKQTKIPPKKQKQKQKT